MRRASFIGLLAALLAVASAPAVFAQETTGAIHGVARDPGGGVLPGVTVQLKGPVGTITAVTDEQGVYRFPRLPPGKYEVMMSLDGFRPFTRTVELTVGSTIEVDAALRLATLKETVEVSAAPLAIDVTSSSAGTTIPRERIALVPRGRDFTDVVSQAPGASDESQAGGISIDGSSGSENRFVIDGIDTTSPQVGTNAVPMRARFMEEVQVKSAGYAAEYGGSTGGVINAITRSGTNNWSGEFVLQFDIDEFAGSPRPILLDSLETADSVYVDPIKDDETRVDPGFLVSGPVWRDRLWFFGAYQPGIRSTTRTVAFSNGVTNSFDQDYRIDYGAANVSGRAGSQLLFRAGANFSPFETDRSLPPQSGRSSLTSAEDWIRGEEGDSRTFSGSVDYLANTQLAISARAGRFVTDQMSTGVEFPDLIHNFSTTSTPAGIAALPPEFREQPGFTSDVLVTDATARDEYIRDFFGVDATWYVSGLGSHQLKVGYQTEKISNDVLSGYNADRILYYAGRPYTIPSTGEQVQGEFGYFRLLNISTQGAVESRNDALFIQDTWRVLPRLTLNVGLRAEHERIPNFGDRGVENPIEFGFDEKLAPRLGFAYDATGDGRTKLYGSYGKYYDVMKYELPRGSFGGDKWVDYFFRWDSPDWTANSAASCATGTNTIDERPACPAGTFIEALDRRFNSAENLDETVEPDLKPMEEDEFQIGALRELDWQNVVVGARYIHKELIRTIEDVGIIVPGVGEQFFIANPGEGISLTLADPGVPNFPKAERQYDALELTFQRRLRNRWALIANYTLSRLYGNYSGLASSDEDGRTSPNVNRFFDHIENTFDRHGNPVLGRLGTDRPHRFSTQFVYLFDWGTSVAVNQTLMSGIPISEEANVSANVPFFPFGRGNLGRTEMLSQTDLKLTHTVPLFNSNLQFEMTVLNLFDQDAVTRRYNNRTVSALPLSTQQFFAGSWDYQTLLHENPDILDVKFNQPDEFQMRRQVRFGFNWRF